MKLEVDHNELSKALSIVGRAVAQRSTLPILGNILLKAEGDALILKATNLEIGIELEIVADVELEGETTVPAKTFVDLIKAMPNKMVSLELSDTGKTLNVECGSFNNRLRVIDAEEFPILAQFNKLDAIMFPADEFHKAVERVAFAACKEESRPILTGVLFDVSEKQFSMAAADGFRLSVSTHSIDVDTEPMSVIVPAKALSEVSRAIGASETVGLHLTLDKNGIVFNLDGVTITSRLIDGQFPNFSAIVPKDSTTSVVVDNGAFTNACKAASVFARESADIAKLTVGVDSIQVNANSAETGDNTSVIDAQVNGPEVTIAFNVSYMLDLLSVVDGDLKIELTKAIKPGLFSQLGDESFIHVIMPMHIRD